MILNKDKVKRANDILQRASDMEKSKLIYSRNWSDYEKVWKMFAEKRTGEDAWRSNSPETWTFATIKTANAAFIDSKVIPTIIRHEDDPTSKAEGLRDLYTDIAEKGNLDLELYYARLDAFKLGIGFLETVYVKDKRTVWEIDKFNPKDDSFTWKKKEINKFDDPKTTRLSPYLVLIDDLARGKNFRDAIILEVMGRSEAEEKYGHLVDFDKIPETTSLLSQLTASTTTNIAETDGTGLRGTEFENLQQYHFFAPGYEWSNDVVEILHYWNSGIMTPSGASDSKEMLINGYPAVVDIKGSPAPIPYIHKQIPLTVIPYSPYSGDEFWASGIIEIGLSEGIEIRSKREMMTDRQKLSLFAPAFSDVNDEIDVRNLKLKPMTIVRTKGGVPKYAQIPGVTNSDLAMLDRDEASFKRATGIDERILGIESQGPAITATEMSFLREAAMKRLKEFAFLYKNALLQQEIKLKLSLFKQYYSNPLASEPQKKNDKADRALKNKFKEFKIKSENTYYKQEVSPNFFEGEVDVDLDLDILLPMTQAQRVTMWSQVLRDSVPFVQAGIIDISLKKVYQKYIEALGTNINALTEDRKALSIEMAESEYELYANPNTAKSMKDILPDGTDKKWLSEDHILKHEELLENDVHMEDVEKALYLEHISADIKNFKTLQAEQQQPNLQALTPQNTGSVGGIGVPAPYPKTAPSGPYPLPQ